MNSEVCTHNPAEVIEQVGLRNGTSMSVHGRTASTMTVKQTNEAFAAAKRKQQREKILD